MAEPKDPEDVSAKLVIYDLPSMSVTERMRLALWLREKSREIDTETPQALAKVFIARLQKLGSH